MVGMIIKGNEAMDTMAVNALAAQNQVCYIKLEEGGCHLYWKEASFKDTCGTSKPHSGLWSSLSTLRKECLIASPATDWK